MNYFTLVSHGLDGRAFTQILRIGIILSIGVYITTFLTTSRPMAMTGSNLAVQLVDRQESHITKIRAQYSGSNS